MDATAPDPGAVDVRCSPDADPVALRRYYLRELAAAAAAAELALGRIARFAGHLAAGLPPDPGPAAPVDPALEPRPDPATAPAGRGAGNDGGSAAPVGPAPADPGPPTDDDPGPDTADVGPRTERVAPDPAPIPIGPARAGGAHRADGSGGRGRRPRPRPDPTDDRTAIIDGPAPWPRPVERRGRPAVRPDPPRPIRRPVDSGPGYGTAPIRRIRDNPGGVGTPPRETPPPRDPAYRERPHGDGPPTNPGIGGGIARDDTSVLPVATPGVVQRIRWYLGL